MLANSATDLAFILLVDMPKLKYNNIMKRFAILTIAVLIIIAGWSGSWVFIAHQIRSQAEQLANPADSTLPAIACNKLSVAGFPFQFAVNCADLSIKYADTIYQLRGIQINVLVYRPTHALVFFDGPLHISNSFFGTDEEVRWSDLKASVRLGGWQLERASLTGEDLAYIDLLIGETRLATTKQLEAHILGNPAGAETIEPLANLSIYSKLEDVALPPANIAGGRLTLEAELTNVLADVRAWPTREIIPRWQADNGRLKLTRLEGDDPTASFSIDGEAGLESGGLLEGAFVAESKGIVERIDQLVPPDMQPIFFGAALPDGSYRQNLNLRAGTVYSGLVPIAQVPPLF